MMLNLAGRHQCSVRRSAASPENTMVHLTAFTIINKCVPEADRSDNLLLETDDYSEQPQLAPQSRQHKRVAHWEKTKNAALVIKAVN